MPTMKSMLVGTLVIAGLAVAACRPERDDITASRDMRASIPGGPPSITGVVTDVGDARRLRIEERPGESAGSAKAVVRLTDGAAILTRAGAAATFDDIRTGTRVSAWFVGPVRESYPVQADANVIVIEPAAP